MKVMNRVRFALQAIVVLLLILIVSSPDRRQVRAVDMWRADGPLRLQRRLISSDPRVIGGESEQRSARIGYGSARFAGTSGVTNRLGQIDSDFEARRFRQMLAAALALGGHLDAIVGVAHTGLNTSVPFARVLLRDTATGQVEARATADQGGRFAFLDVTPSGYVAEVVGADGSTIAASTPIAVSAGGFQQATVRVTAASTIAGMFGSLLTSTAPEPVLTAAAAGIPKAAPPDRTVSPQQ
jgi:hypothetical protein